MSWKHSDKSIPNPDRLLTAAEVARLLHISRSLLYDLIQQGELPTIHVGHALRFRIEDVQDYLHRRLIRLHKPPPPSP